MKKVSRWKLCPCLKFLCIWNIKMPVAQFSLHLEHEIDLFSYMVTWFEMGKQED